MNGWNIRAACGDSLPAQDRAALAARKRAASDAAKWDCPMPPLQPFRRPKTGRGHRPRLRVARATGAGQRDPRGTHGEKLPSNSNREREHRISTLLAERETLRALQPRNRRERRIHRAMLHRNGQALALEGWED